MSDELLGVIRVVGTGFVPAHEELFFIPDRVIVARTGGGRSYALGLFAVGLQVDAKHKELRTLPTESVLKADKNNYAILNSEIKKIEINKKHGILSLQIETKDKKRKWYALGVIEKEEETSKEVSKGQLSDYAKILKPIFGGKLSFTPW